MLNPDSLKIFDDANNDKEINDLIEQLSSLA
jgi:hypothetical protein